jgi:malonate transporter and related proteins
LDFLATHWRLAAIAALFFLGVFLRRMGWAGEELGRRLLNFVFFVGLPILIFGALTGVPLAREHALLPVAAVCVSLVGWGIAAFVAQRLSLTRAGEGSLALCAMSLNISMIYPFASLSLAPQAFSELVMFDMGHAVMAWTLTTVVACKYGGHPDDIPVLLARTLASPPLWVLAIALSLNVAGAPISKDFLAQVLRVGQACVLLVPLAMGLLVSARGLRRTEMWSAVVLRSAIGISLGFTLGWALGLEGSAARVAMLGAAAPIGFTAVVLSARESLDIELAASAAAISVFAGALWIPLAVTFV